MPAARRPRHAATRPSPRRTSAVLLALLALAAAAGCGNRDRDDRDRLVPQGTRRTVVTADDPVAAPARADSSRGAPAIPAAGDTTASAAGAGDTIPRAAGAGDTAAAAWPEDRAPADTALAGPARPAPSDAPAPPPAAGAFTVQAGAFRNLATAQEVAARLRGAGVASRVETATVGGATVHRVVVPDLADRAAADALAARLARELGIDAVVRRP